MDSVKLSQFLHAQKHTPLLLAIVRNVKTLRNHNLKTIVVIIHILVLLGCSASESNKKLNVSYTGLWYNQSVDSYLEITDDGDVFLRDCSVHDGYTVDDSFEGRIVNNTLRVTKYYEEPKDFLIELSNDNLYLINETEMPAIPYVKTINLPSECYSDAFEITYLNPLSLDANELTTFTVNLDYRLSRHDEADIRVSYNDDEYIYLGEILSNGLGSTAFMFDIVPQLPSALSAHSIRFIMNWQGVLLDSDSLSIELIQTD